MIFTFDVDHGYGRSLGNANINFGMFNGTLHVSPDFIKNYP